jgi:N-acetylmuramate 1-kinase
MSTFSVPWADPARQRAFEAWFEPLCEAQGLDPHSLRPASADASFRRYLRVDGLGAAAGGPPGSRIVMDAPPPQEDVRPFVDITARLQRAGVPVPAVHAADLAQGFVLLDDLGEHLLLEDLQAAVASDDRATPHRLMVAAIDNLVQMQARTPVEGLPAYDDALLQRELDLFPTWCVQRECGIGWTAAQQTTWERACERLKASALAQPTVFVHRDYMPRNLMRGTPTPAVLDFQDAVRGPISYDVASLLRDAFISWDEEREIDWAVRYWERARKAGLPVDGDFGEFWRQLEWMGLQRHLKVLGIFCRLKHRDDKPRYSTDLPRFFRYAHKVATRYHGLGALAGLIEQASGTERQAGFTF